MSTGSRKPKMNPILAWLLVSVKLTWFCIFHGGQACYLDYDTGEVIPADR